MSSPAQTLQPKETRLSLGRAMSVLAVAYFVLWGCMPIAHGPPLIPLADETHTQHNLALGAGDLGELQTGRYAGLQYTWLKAPKEGRNWAFGGRLLASYPELTGSFYAPTAGLGLLARRSLGDSENRALQLEIGGLWASASLPMSWPTPSGGRLLLQPGLQLAPGHGFGLLHLPVGWAVPVGQNLWISAQAQAALQSHLGLFLLQKMEGNIENDLREHVLEPGYGISLGLHWQGPKKTLFRSVDNE